VVSRALVWSGVVWCGLGWSGVVSCGFCYFEVQGFNDHWKTVFQVPKAQFSYYLKRGLVWSCVVLCGLSGLRGLVVLCGLKWSCVVLGGFVLSRVLWCGHVTNNQVNLIR
jgi:hypothetical protein